MSASPFITVTLGAALLLQGGHPPGLSLASRAPVATESETELAAGSEGSVAATDPDAALSKGDLQTALERARAQREAEPTAAHWATEARVLEARGELVAAKKAYAAALRADGADDLDRSSVESKIEALEEQSRGRVPDEPESSHREQLDAERAERLAPPPDPEPKPTPPPPADEVKIVNKWYFWVTLAAIVASAGAITGIAIKAASDERKDSLDRAATLPSSPAMLRF